MRTAPVTRLLPLRTVGRSISDDDALREFLRLNRNASW